LAVVLIAPLALQRDVAALRHIAPVSVMSLVYMAGVIAAKAPVQYCKHLHDAGPVRFCNVGLSNLEAFAICVFAFNCHMNVVPVAGNLIRPSKARITAISAWVNGIQFFFYSLIGVSGYLSFMAATDQDVICNYSFRDPFVAVGRVLLTGSMFVAVPINLFPTVRSAMQISDFFRSPRSPALLAPSPCSSPAATGRQRYIGAGTSNDLGERRRLVLTLLCLLMQACVAYSAQGVADVLGFLGALVATPMMMVIPGYAISVCMPKTRTNKAKVIFLYSCSLVSAAAVPIKILRWTHVID